MMRVWMWPIAIAVLSLSGLLAGLVSENSGDWWAWCSLLVPVWVSAAYGLRRS